MQTGCVWIPLKWTISVAQCFSAIVNPRKPFRSTGSIVPSRTPCDFVLSFVARFIADDPPGTFVVLRMAVEQFLLSLFTPTQGFFFGPSPAFLGGKEKDGGEGKGDGRHWRWQCGAGGSTRVEFRERGYLRQIIGNC